MSVVTRKIHKICVIKKKRKEINGEITRARSVIIDFLSQCNLAVVRKMYHIVANQRAYVLLTKANHLIVRLEKNKQTNAVTILSKEGKKLLSLRVLMKHNNRKNFK